MPINLPLIFRLTFTQLFRSKGTHARFTSRRRRAMLLWYLVMPIHQLLTLICFYLDEIFFPAYRRQAIKAPVFIVGNFRSGSSLLQRLLADDQKRFTSMNVAEIYIAPTLTQRKFWGALRWLDARLFGGRGLHWLQTRDRQWLGNVRMHKVGLFTPDEDEGLLIMLWATMFLQFVFPMEDQLPPYHRFDEDIPEPERHRIMGFYRAIIRRHLYWTGGESIYLAKGPAHSGRIDSLYEFFPDARIIYLARNPLQLVPSVTNFFSYIWHLFGDPLQRHPLQDYVFAQIKYWYRYPMERLRARPPDGYMVLRYDQLVDDLASVIEQIYDWMKLPISTAFSELIERVVLESRYFETDNIYTLEELGLSEQQIYTEFRPVFDFFGFKPEPARSALPQ